MIERMPVLVVAAGGAPSLAIVHAARTAGCSPILCDDRGAARRALVANRIFMAVVETGDDLNAAADLCSWLRQQPGGRQIRIIACAPGGWSDLLPLVDAGADDIASFEGDDETLTSRLTIAKARLLSKHRESPFDFPNGHAAGSPGRAHLLPHELLTRIRQMAWDETELPRLYRSFIEGAATTFGFSEIALYTVEGSTLVLRHLVGTDRQVDRISFERGIIGRVARTDRPAVIEDVSREPDYIGGAPGVSSEICVPFHAGGAVIGVINIESMQGDVLDERDLPLVLALRDHLEAAIARIRLADESSARRRELEARFLASPAGLIEIDGNFRIVAVNDVAAAQLGAGREDLDGTLLSERCDPQSRTQVEQTLAQIAHGLIPGGSVTLTGAGGRILELALSTTPDAEPRLSGALSDVTTRNETEAQLARAAEIFAGLAASELTIGFIDTNGAIEIAGGGKTLPISTRRDDAAIDVRSLVDAGDWAAIADTLSTPSSGGTVLRVRVGTSEWLELRFAPGNGREKRLVVMHDASAEHAGAQAAADLLHRYRASFDNPIAPSAVLDAGGRFTVVSESLASLLGYHPEELLGFALQQITYPEDVEEAFASFRQLMTGEEQDCLAHRRVFHRDGRVIPLLVHATAIPGSDDRSREIVVTVISLGQEQDLERELEAVSGRYDSLVNALPVITFTSPRDPADTLNLFYSPQVEAMLGYSIEHLARDIDRFYEFIHPDDLDRINAADTAAERENEAFDQTYRFIRGDGRVIWLRVQSVPVFGEGDEANYWQGIMTDVTALKQSELRAVEHIAQFQDLIDGAPFLIATANRDGAMLTVNNAVERILGIEASDLTAGRLALEVHPQDREALRALFAQPAAGSIEARFRHRDGHWVRFRLDAVHRRSAESATDLLLYGVPIDS
jgi:PAS domain S-box-containing protein